MQRQLDQSRGAWTATHRDDRVGFCDAAEGKAANVADLHLGLRGREGAELSAEAPRVPQAGCC